MQKMGGLRGEMESGHALNQTQTLVLVSQLLCVTSKYIRLQLLFHAVHLMNNHKYNFHWCYCSFVETRQVISTSQYALDE